MDKGQALAFLHGTVTPSLGCTEPACTALAAAAAAGKLWESDGICAATPEQCIANVARIANVGMANVDAEILKIMLAKK